MGDFLSVEENAGPSTPFGAKNAPNSAQDDGFFLNEFRMTDLSSTNFWLGTRVRLGMCGLDSRLASGVTEFRNFRDEFGPFAGMSRQN
jgi:hypothetical protein